MVEILTNDTLTANILVRSEQDRNGMWVQLCTECQSQQMQKRFRTLLDVKVIECQWLQPTVKL